MVCPGPVGDQHGSQQRAAAGEDQAVDGDDDRSALEVFELGMRDFAVDLGQAFLAAHGENGVAKGHQDAEEAEDRQSPSAQETKRIVTEMEVGWDGRWRQRRAAKPNSVSAPNEQNDHHDRGDLHNPQSLIAGFLDPFDVLPPVINRDHRAQQRGGVIHIELDRMAACVRSVPGVASVHWSATFNSSLTMPVMYWPADTPEIGPVRM